MADPERVAPRGGAVSGLSLGDPDAAWQRSDVCVPGARNAPDRRLSGSTVRTWSLPREAAALLVGSRGELPAVWRIPLGREDPGSCGRPFDGGHDRASPPERSPRSCCCSVSSSRRSPGRRLRILFSRTSWPRASSCSTGAREATARTISEAASPRPPAREFVPGGAPGMSLPVPRVLLLFRSHFPDRCGLRKKQAERLGRRARAVHWHVDCQSQLVYG